MWAVEHAYQVALRKESVDRNMLSLLFPVGVGVALRKESVDRNSIALASLRAYTVALRKESVDRNAIVEREREHNRASLSARRAWIEIGRCVA